MHQIKFYPVGNGDTAQIILSNGKRILLDYRHHTAAEDDKTPYINLKTTLKQDLTSAQRDSFDVVAFTHADKDHIEGSTDFFFLEHAQKYQDSGRIKIKELWVPAAMVVEKAKLDEQSNEFVILRQEARHRLKEGKGIKIFSRPPELIDYMAENNIPYREEQFVDAGTIVPTFNLAEDGVEFFCHSPYKKHIDGGGKEIRNQAALIFHVRMKDTGNTKEFFAIGDSEAEVLQDIVNITRYHNERNGRSKNDRLEWDIYKAPHHCSYLALNTSGNKGATTTQPLGEIDELLRLGRPDCFIVSSSLAIDKDKERNQPPHVQAKNTYKDYVENHNDGNRFLVTMEEPNKIVPKTTTFKTAAIGFSLATIANVSVAGPEQAPPRAGGKEQQ